MNLQLDLMEDPMLNVLTKTQYFKAFITALDNGTEMSTTMIDRLLAVCVQELELDKKSTIYALKIIEAILKRIQGGSCPTLPNLLPSILALLNLIKTTASINKLESMQTLCFEILMSYPNETLIDIASLHTSEIVEVFNYYCHEQIPLQIRVLPCELILKLLKILPPEKKSIFVKNNLSVWFSKVLPTAVTASNLLLPEKALETLECLTEELVPIDYSENSHWLEIFERIHNPAKYPTMMLKQMANKKNTTWHRLWIVFIRLLKHQITKTSSSQASPINSMLPVVEQAFKMDVANRCRAFECWNVLIDNFRKETSEAYVNKRLKLLIIPLMSNNAKVDETALAKLHTWWHLIHSYQDKLDKFVDKILISFLHFCFGKHVAMSPKIIIVPGQISTNTKKKSVEAFIGLAGHLSCDGCVNVPKLNRRIISTAILVDHWNDWVYSLKVAMLNVNEDVGITIEQLECLWKSLVITVAEMPDNNIRKDLFNELLTMLENVEKTIPVNENLAKIVFHLLASLFTEEKIKVLFKPRQEGPVHKIMMLLLGPSLNIFYKRGSTSDIVKKIKPVTKYLLETKILIPWLFNSALKDLENFSLVLTALAEIVCETKYEEVGELTDFMMWPLKSTNKLTDEEYCTKAWVKLVNYMYPKLKANVKEKLRTGIGRDIVPSNTHLKLHLCLAILNYELANGSVVGCTKNVELLMMVMNKIENSVYVGDNIAILTEAVIAIINKIKEDVYSSLLKNTLTIIKNLLKFINPILEGTNEIEGEKIQSYEKLLTNVEVVIQKNAQSPLMSIIMDELLNIITQLHTNSSVKSHVINILKLFTSTCKNDSPTLNKVKDAVDIIESKPVTCEADDGKLLTDSKFAAPDAKPVTKKVKRKETTVVSTVVENGEEYEIIKSNWKFNPRKLTENQKEKLQRKREDIPALYQDLSQSQDDFKLTTWKTDSQDTSSTNSKSTTNSKSDASGNVSEILKNIPSSDVVPKIIENIFSEKKDVDISAKEKPVSNSTSKLKQTTIKDPKSPRMALQDRVFRNVRNLIEKSSLQKDTKDLSESLVQVENMPKTPPSKNIDNSHLVNSAPPNLGTDRPSRLKRKPKKFDDVQIFSLKKSRRSSSLNDSQTEIETQVSNDETGVQKSLSETDKDAPPSDKIITENEKPTKVSTSEVTKDIDDLIENKICNVKEKQTVIQQETVPERALKKDNVVLNKKLSSDLGSASEISTPVAIENEHVNPDKDIGLKPTIVRLEEKAINVESTPPKSACDPCSSTVTKDVEDLPKKDTSNEKCLDEAPQVKDNNHDDKTSATNKSSTKSIKTLTVTKIQEIVEARSGRRNSARKSRIEKELAIDTVEGHPFLKIQTEKRVTRKNVNIPLNNSRRKSLSDKLNKSKLDTKNPTKVQTNSTKKKDKESLSSDSDKSVTISESQDNCSEISDIPCSEDVIESSQDSSFTTISVKPKPVLKKVSVVLPLLPFIGPLANKTQDELTMDVDNKDDTELPQNKTSASNDMDLDLTENMDTQPVDNEAIEEDRNSSDVIIINDDEEPIVISSETQEIAEADTQPSSPSSETQEIAEADTQPTNSSDFNVTDLQNKINPSKHISADEEIQISNLISANTDSEITTTMNLIDISTKLDDDHTLSSPLKDEEKRKKDFLDNTLEISPIKTMSPVRDKKSPSPETSSDYVVIKLSSPVQSNGEPFEKCDSPEIFTEDKVSPDKRDLSPPREESVVTNTSPSSSLSLKKNRPQVRPGGRAAQMLGLCVPDRLQTIMTSERSEPEESKKSSPCSTPARRNLRILYNSVGADSSENSEENEDNESFLKFKRTLPTSDCSPSGPILKRKLVEITDEATISPASKRKRVSFHDPPVSTTIAVQKYIEPCGIRSPQNSALKRQERQNLRSQTVLTKSPKRLDNVFKLDTVLTKAVESFTEGHQSSTDITQSMSLDETPAVEIIRNSDLNNIDPICPDLVGCNDPIDGIAAELTSATMKSMFLKEIEGKIATIGDLAKMTELEINRLCIKAPKIKIARKVLGDYAPKNKVVTVNGPVETIEILEDEIFPVVETVEKSDIEVQTNDVVTSDVEIQTTSASMTAKCVQTDKKATVNTSAQTNDSGAKSTKNLISSCMTERPDFVENLCKHLEESTKLRIAETLPANTIRDMFMKSVTSANSNALITRILQSQHGSSTSTGNDLLFMQNYLCDRFNNRDLILFCSQLLAKIHSKQL